MEAEPKMRKYASVRQINHLVNFMFDNRDVATNRFSSSQGRLQLDTAWADLAEQLNAMGGGTIKSVEKWKQTWRDLKANTKKKASRIRRERLRTGGGTIKNVEVLTEIEEKVVAVMGVDAIVGIEEVVDTQILHTVPRTSTVPEPQEGILILSTSDPSQLEVTATPVTTDAPQPEVTREVASSGSTPARQGQEGTLTGTPWSQRRLAQRQKRKRTLANIEERALKIEAEKLELEKAKFQFEKKYKLEKLLTLKRIATALQSKK